MRFLPNGEISLKFSGVLLGGSVNGYKRHKQRCDKEIQQRWSGSARLWLFDGGGGDGGTGVEELFEFGGGFAAEAGDFGDLLDGGETEALDGTEFFQEGLLAAF